MTDPDLMDADCIHGNYWADCAECGLAPVPCEVCGPQTPPTIHTICHVGPNKPTGCGHSIKKHTQGMKCTVCHAECGLRYFGPLP